MKRPRVLVVFHVFYHEHVKYFIDKLRNISGCDWDLVVSYTARSRGLERLFSSLNRQIRFVEVDNAGYDVWPFIQVLRDVDFSNYDYVLKLHTKGHSKATGKLDAVPVEGFAWRDILVNALLKDSVRFKRCLLRFMRKPRLGLLCSYELLTAAGKVLPEDTFLLKKEADRIGVTLGRVRFCAGTIFMARIDALRKLKDIHFTHEMWTGEQKSNSMGTLAHVYERLLCVLVENEGYRISSIYSSKGVTARKIMDLHGLPLAKWLFSLERVCDPDSEGEDMPKYMTLFGMKFKLDEGKGKGTKIVYENK